MIGLEFLFGTLQAQTVTLTFTGRYAANQYVQLDHIFVTNLTKGWQEIIYWPDTTLTMQNGTGIDESVANGGFALSQNNPNPFSGTTDLNLTVADAGAVTLEIVDGNARIVETQSFASLPIGTNQFRISLSAAGTYVMSARQNGKSSSIKMVCNDGGNGNRIEYMGASVETWCTATLQPKSITTNPFDLGDQMEYVGYASINGTEVESLHITQVQNASQTFALLFPTATGGGHPCPGNETITDIDGNVYNTVLIGNQCWMKENLRTTKYADYTPIPAGGTYSDTDPYRYAPNNDESNVATFGYLYNWPAVMHAEAPSEANPSGVQGICPNGWHVPSDAEWTQLTDYVSSRGVFVCGSDNSYIAKALAATTGWYECDYECAVGNDQSANNATGFSALPTGYYYSDGYYYFSFDTNFWGATADGENQSCWRNIDFSWAYMHRYCSRRDFGYSVRCLCD
ncbi:MAG: hypothetical protein J6X65_01135 [Bacteroidales bacterium]|nr:hypothetical protein [Bacteroidales bacterium]